MDNYCPGSEECLLNCLTNIVWVCYEAYLKCKEVREKKGCCWCMGAVIIAILLVAACVFTGFVVKNYDSKLESMLNETTGITNITSSLEAVNVTIPDKKDEYGQIYHNKQKMKHETMLEAANVTIPDKNDEYGQIYHQIQKMKHETMLKAVNVTIPDKNDEYGQIYHQIQKIKHETMLKALNVTIPDKNDEYGQIYHEIQKMKHETMATKEVEGRVPIHSVETSTRNESTLINPKTTYKI